MLSKIHEKVGAVLGAALLSFAMAGCGGGGGGGSSPDLSPPIDMNIGMVSFSQIQTQVFIAQCGIRMNGGRNCHLLSPPEGSLNLTVGMSYADLVNVPAYISPNKMRVKPGDPDNSFLWQKINDILGPTEGNPMPFQTGGKAAPISEDLRLMVRAWIAEGAPNN